MMRQNKIKRLSLIWIILICIIPLSLPAQVQLKVSREIPKELPKDIITNASYSGFRFRIEVILPDSAKADSGLLQYDLLLNGTSLAGSRMEISSIVVPTHADTLMLPVPDQNIFYYDAGINWEKNMNEAISILEKNQGLRYYLRRSSKSSCPGSHSTRRYKQGTQQRNHWSHRIWIH